MIIIKRITVDMTEGNIFRHIVRFTVPIMISGVLQILYNVADTAVVGKFSGDAALAAVGSTGPAINVMINLFFGIASAVNVHVAQKFGGDREELSKAVHTSVALSLVLGVALGILGMVLSEPMLRLMGSPADVRPLSALYMRIYFMGMPAVMVFNVGSAISRAVGDSKRPMLYSVLSGTVNVALNLFFVVVLHMSVAGVALATVISGMLSAVLVVRLLVKGSDCVALKFRGLKIHRGDAKQLLILGVPAGLQSTLISLSNVVVQASVNACGSVAMAASSAANGLEGIVYIALYAFFQTAITFTGQNYGSKRFGRIRKGFLTSLLVSFGFAVVYSQLMLRLSPWTLRLYSDSEEVIALATQRMNIVCASYFLCVVSEVANGALRGLGVVNQAVLLTLTCDLGVRIVMTAIGAPFETAQELNFLFLSFPISWVLSGVSLTLLFLYHLNEKEKKRKVDDYDTVDGSFDKNLL